MADANRPGAGRRRVLGPVVVVAAAATALALLALQACPGDSDGEGDAGRRDENGGGTAREPSPVGSGGSGPARTRRAGSGRSPATSAEESTGRSMTVRIRSDAVEVGGATVTLESLAETQDAIFGERAVGFGRMVFSDGVARFEDLPPPPLVLRWTPFAGAAPGTSGGLRILRRIEDVEVAFEPDGVLRGVVVDPTGRGVPGRAILLHRDEPSPWSDFPEQVGDQSGENGGFEFRLPAGRWWILVPAGYRKDDPLAERCGPFETGREDVRIVLDGAGPTAGIDGPRIAGTAKWPDGRPAVGWVWFVRGADPGESIDRTPHSATGDGTFRSPALVKGRLYDVVLRDDGGGRTGHGWALARDVPGGAGWVDFVAQRSRGAQGRVVDAAGRGLAGVVVTATLRPDVTIDPFDLEATSDADGRFAFPTVPPFALRFVAGGSGTDWCTPDPPHFPEGSSGEVVVRVVPTVAVAGTVVFEDGTPVSGGHVLAAGRRARVDRDGTFRIESLVPGPARVSWTPATDFGIGPVDLGTATAPSTGTTLTLVLPR